MINKEMQKFKRDCMNVWVFLAGYKEINNLLRNLKPKIIRLVNDVESKRDMFRTPSNSNKKVNTP